MFSTIIAPLQLLARLGSQDLVIVDCRFKLTDAQAGLEQYRAGHIPHAVYVHLNDDLSGAPHAGRGRHPLPPVHAIRALFSRLGVGTGRQVVAYDDAGGANAARCWWMLRYMGHAAAAVLDGGWQAWLAMGGTVERSRSAPAGGVEFAGEPHARGVVSCAEVPAVRQLVDARDPARYRGDHEPFDPVAGHIPGAINHYWQWNLDADGRFHSAADLAGRWLASLGAAPSADTVHYCGSGVTACHNVLSQVLAGFPMPRVYVGSWSEWCSDPSRAIATG